MFLIAIACVCYFQWSVISPHTYFWVTNSYILSTFSPVRTVPSPPYNLTVLEVTATTIKVEWHEPANPNGLIDGYRVVYINQNETYIQTKTKHKEPGPIISYVLANLSECLRPVSCGSPLTHLRIVVLHLPQSPTPSTSSRCARSHGRTRAMPPTW